LLLASIAAAKDGPTSASSSGGDSFSPPRSCHPSAPDIRRVWAYYHISPPPNSC
jgi:hypothetical protein